jgi:asparagine synthase (glutamine-hydrolysing)
MCGISGIIDPGSGSDELGGQLRGMLQRIGHRGPDDQGIWVHETDGIALGHRRLSILDLSSAGHQPMTSACGRFVIVFNGEIYNHLELRKRLGSSNALASVWRGTSDTETLLALISTLGLVQALQHAVGMFAFALWDERDRTLFLARDRLGEKPLYYGWQKGVFLFGSELKALRAHPRFAASVDWSAAASFLRTNYISAPGSIYEGIHKLRPGTILSLTEADRISRTVPKPIPYWSVEEAASRGMERPFHGSFHDAVDELGELLGRAVKEQSLADVPVGAFLSGGIDSSTIVALMRHATSSSITTFSIGMPEASMDESQHAKAVANHLQTNHVAHVIQPHEALELIPILPTIWDEPFADSSQIPTYLVSRLARYKVTVALSGDGGDELFLGYPRYALCQKIWRSRGLRGIPWTVALDLMSGAPGAHAAAAARKMRSVLGAWRQPTPQALYSYWMDNYRHGAVPLQLPSSINAPTMRGLDCALTSFSVVDAGSYLPDDVLVKVDRASMANSLETRAPLLDHRVVEFAYRLPSEYKSTNSVGKRVLRELLYRLVPRHLVDRPKMGFALPMSRWLRRDLRPWAEDLLLGGSKHSAQFDQRSVQRIWNDHLAGNADNTERLWGLLTLKSWLRDQ